MQVQLVDICSDPNDFKVCQKCRAINWYENEMCTRSSCTSSSFVDSEEAVLEEVYKWYEIYEDIDGMSEMQIDVTYIVVR